jgi:hypothetical protein
LDYFVIYVLAMMMQLRKMVRTVELLHDSI